MNNKLRSEVLVEMPHAPRWLAILLTTFFIIIICILIYSPWQQTAFGLGRVIAYAPDDRIQAIAATIDGRIAKWFVAEGVFVKKGDPIVTISDIDPNIMERLQSEMTAALQKLEAAQKGVQTSQLNLERQDDLSKKGLSSKRAYELAQLEYSKLLSELSGAASELARLEVRVARQSSQIVVAPRDGTIQRIFGAQGGVIVKIGDTIAQLVPNIDSRAVEILVDGNDVPLLSIGRKARLQFEGWPAVQFVGWPSVAVGTFGGTIGFIDAADDGTGKFRVIIFPDSKDDLWPQAQYLRQGVRAQGWIMLDTVKLWYELWRRFNGFPQTIKKPIEENVLGKGAYNDTKKENQDAAKK